MFPASTDVESSFNAFATHRCDGSKLITIGFSQSTIGMVPFTWVTIQFWIIDFNFYRLRSVSGVGDSEDVNLEACHPKIVIVMLVTGKYISP